ncbi:hypothetical protein DI273_30655 [Streptomyces violascens]|nr:hypothetical protein DI273_30655 [Streptomyces violascens]
MARQERALRTREALIRAGAEHFARDGFVAASLSTISRSAGVSNGALHFHFENKRALAQAVGEHARRTLRLVVEEAWAGARTRCRCWWRRRSVWCAASRTTSCCGPASSWAPQPRGRLLAPAGVAVAGGRDGRAGRGRGVDRPGCRAEDVVTAVVAATVGFESMAGRQGLAVGDTVRGFWDLLLPRLTDQPAGLFFPTGKRPQSRYEMPPFDRMGGRTEGPSGA